MSAESETSSSNMDAIVSGFRRGGILTLFPGFQRPFLRRVPGTLLDGSAIVGARAAVEAAPPADSAGTPLPDMLLASEIILTGGKVAEGFLIERVAISWLAIFKRLSADPHFLLQFDPRQFEELIAAAYDAEGCEVILTPRSADGGRDVIATYPGFGKIRILDQVKRYNPKHKVSADDVRSLFGVLYNDKAASKGVITTTSTFAPGVAAEFAEAIPTRLLLREGKDILELITELAERER